MYNVRGISGSLLTCIIEVIIGILLLINPISFTTGIIMALGIVLIIIGGRSLIDYFRAEANEASKANGLSKGILCVCCGLFCAFKSEWFLVTFPILTAFYGVLILVFGIGKIQWAVDSFRMKQKYWFVAIISAILSILFAVMILLNPFTSTSMLWIFIGVSLIIEAIADIVTFIFEKK